jgi:hypothetical protein
MSTVFLDTVGMLAQWDQSDQWHEGASRALRELVARGDRTVSTTFVFLECGNAAALFQDGLDHVADDGRGELVFRER